MGNLTFNDALTLEAHKLAKTAETKTINDLMLDCHLELANARKDFEYDRMADNKRADSIRLAKVLILILTISGKYGIDIGGAYEQAVKIL